MAQTENTDIEQPNFKLPNNWSPRPYQQASKDAFDAGLRRQLLIWHRRAGKDVYGMNLAAEESQKTIGSYWHLYPLHVQAKRAIWRGINDDGIKFMDQAFPLEMREGKPDNQDMVLTFKNGSTWQLCGSNNYDRLVGSNVRGVVFSEWALCDPKAWEYIRPILRENGGWAIFITTYRGRNNHAYSMVQLLKDNPNWYVDIRDVTMTTRHDGSPVLSEADIQAERDDGMPEDLIQQEFYCAPVAALAGAYYGRQLSLAYGRKIRLAKEI